MATTSENLHEVDVHPVLGEQLFDIVDFAWQSALAGTGDKFDTRYDGLERVGLALTTSAERLAKSFGQDNPIAVLPISDDYATLTRRPSSAAVPSTRLTRGILIGYRYNDADRGAEITHEALGLRTANQVPPDVARHGRYPINAAAKRFYLLNNPEAETSHDPKGLQTGFTGEIGAAGGIRYADGQGIVTISGGNQAHDHVANRHYAFLAQGAMHEGIEEVDDGSLLELEIATANSMRATIEHIKDYVAGRFAGRRLDEITHCAYGQVIAEADRFLLEG